MTSVAASPMAFFSLRRMLQSPHLSQNLAQEQDPEQDLRKAHRKDLNQAHAPAVAQKVALKVLALDQEQAMRRLPILDLNLARAQALALALRRAHRMVLNPAHNQALSKVPRMALNPALAQRKVLRMARPPIKAPRKAQMMDLNLAHNKNLGLKKVPAAESLMMSRRLRSTATVRSMLILTQRRSQYLAKLPRNLPRKRRLSRSRS